MHAQARGAWRETRTAHCVFIYQPADEAAVRELCGFAEEVYAEVSAYFDTYPREVRAVVLGAVDISNGAYSAPPHHLELYVRSPTAPWHGARGESWLKLLFIHELAHYCDMDADYGFFSVLSYIFGEGAKSSGNAFLPPWTYEGVAVLLETDFSRGGRGRNPFFSMYAKAMLLDDVPFTLGHLEYASAYPPPERYYLFGYFFVDYLKRHYGADVYRNIRKTFLEFPLFGPWHAIRYVTGRHQDELWADFRAELKERFREEAPDRAGTPVTPPGLVSYHAPRAAAGTWLAYRTAIDRPQAIVALEPREKRERVIVEAGLTDEYSYAVSADGRRLVYAETTVSGLDPGRYREISDLYLAELTTGDGRITGASHIRKLTAGRRLWHPCFSPDGSFIVAVQGAGTYSRLVRVDPASGRVSVIFAARDTNVYNPVYSPDGRWLAFVINRNGQQDIGLMDATVPPSPQETAGEPLQDVNADMVRRLPARDAAGDYFPRFLDDHTLLFTSDREGVLALYTCSLDGNALTRVCRDRIAAFDAVAVPEGLLYTTYRANGYGLELSETAGLEAVALAPPVDEPIPPSGTRPEISSAPYTDLPGFQFWIPNANLTYLGDTLYIGVGIYVYFASVMDSNGFDVSAVYYPDLQQPEFSFSSRTQLGPCNVTYTLTHVYGQIGREPSALYDELFTQMLNLELPLVDEAAFSRSNYFSVSVGLQHTYLLEDTSPFSFLGSFGYSPVYSGHFPSASGELYYYHAKYAGPAALFPPWKLVNALDVLVPLPFLSETRVGAVVLDYFYATLPGLWNLSSFRLGWKVCYESPDMLGASYVEPRGAFPATAQTVPLRGILSLEYMFTIAYLDCPVVGGTHLDALGAGLHWEVPWDADPGTGTLSLDRYSYAGVELSLVLGLGKLEVPLTLGAALRLDWQGTDPLGTEDFRFYFQLTLNTFWLGAKTRRASRTLDP